MEEHTLPDLYNTVYNIKQALKGGGKGYPVREPKITNVYKRGK